MSFSISSWECTFFSCEALIEFLPLCAFHLNKTITSTLNFQSWDANFLQWVNFQKMFYVELNLSFAEKGSWSWEALARPWPTVESKWSVLEWWVCSTPWGSWFVLNLVALALHIAETQAGRVTPALFPIPSGSRNSVSSEPVGILRPLILFTR